MLDKYGVKGTFYAITGQIGDKIAVEDLRHLASFHEVGAHTVTHPHLCRIGIERAQKEIFDSKATLERILDKPDVMSFAYPYGEYSDVHLIMLKQAGFCCGRTNKPFFIEHPKNMYEMPVSVWAYPHALKDLQGFFRLGRIIHSVIGKPYMLKNWSDIAKKLLDVVVQRGGVFHLVGHGWQVEQSGGWKNLEEVLSYVASQRNVICTTVAKYPTLAKSVNQN
jgi:peptidoglycan/xylan/chitin deacetylase (PgdA/CDA1 family)